MRPAFSPFIVLGLLAPLAAGCASTGPQAEFEAAATPAPQPVTAASNARPHVGTSTVAAICGYPGGRAVLDRDLPGLTQRPEFMFFKSMTLRAMEPMSGGRLTDADLLKVDIDLAALPPAMEAAAPTR